MPPKRSKSQTGSAGTQKWEAGLVAAQFNEEGKWEASVSFLIQRQVEDLQNLKVLTDTVNTGCRKLFSVITKDELYETVRDLGNIKNPKKGKEIPQFAEICEPCKVFLDSNEEIPLVLQAKLIKFKLLDIKSRDLKRRDAEKKASSDGNKIAGGKAAKGADKKGGERAKSAGKGAKGGKKTPDLPSAKNESKLRKRGEEDEEGKYIDDEPDDGPQHYVIVAGFHSPHLFGLLVELGVNVDSIISLGTSDYSVYLPKENEDEDLESKSQLPPAEVQEGAMKERLKAEKTLRIFWKDVKYLLESPPLYDIARLSTNISAEDTLQRLAAQSPEQKEESGKAIFEVVACLIYDMLDAKRQWKNYRNNLNLHHVPVFGQQTAPSHYPDEKSTMAAPTPSTKKAEGAGATTEDGKSLMAESEVKPAPEVDTRYYEELMDSVPQETVSVPLIMHCMLQQVVATEENRDPPSEIPKPKREDGLDDSLAKHISLLAFKLALSEEEQQLLAREFDAPRLPDIAPRTPLLLNYRDELCERVHHLKSGAETGGDDNCGVLHPLRAELEMMGLTPLAGLCRGRTPSERIQAERTARLQELVHFVATGGLTQAEVDRAFKQFVFECLDLTETDEIGNILPKSGVQRDVPWDDPYPYFKGMVPLEDDYDEEVEALMQSGDFAATSAAQEIPTEKGPTPHPRTEEVPKAETPPPENNSGSRPSTPGILKRSDSTGSRRSSSGKDGKTGTSTKVHFERTKQGDLVPQPGDEPGTEKEHTIRPLLVTEEGWSEVNDKQQRLLDQWCFAEHMDPAVFLQVLRSTQYTHPVMDTYYHKRDNSLLVVMHNPMNETLTNHFTWHTKLHSDVGFRKYLGHIADSIQDWTLQEVAKYQAGLVAHEVEDIVKEAEAEARPDSAGKGKKGAAKKDAKKGAKSPTRSASRSSSQEREKSDENPYVRANSLKAFKEEKDRLKAEEEEKEREKEMKRIKSAEKKNKEKEAKEKEEKAKKGGKPGSRQNSAKSKGSKEEVNPADEAEGAPREPERYWPFSGYDMGNNLIEVHGQTTSLFPADGGQVRVDKVDFESGPSSVRTVVLKDGHVFSVHVLGPRTEGEDQPEEPTPPPTPRSTDGGETAAPTAASEAEAETQPTVSEEASAEPKKPCVGCFGSFTTQFKDGMNLAFSIYGDQGEPVDGAKYAPEPYVPPRPPTPAPADGKATPGKGKDKGKGKAATPEPTPAAEEEEVKSEAKASESVKVASQPFQQLHISCPDGVVVNYSLESSVGIEPEFAESRKILVRQNYPFRTRGTQECEAGRQRATQEASRVINMEGTVVKTMLDGTVQVLFADGTVSEFVQNSPVIPSGSRSTSLERPGSGKNQERDSPAHAKKASRQSKRSPRKKETVEEEQPEEAPPTGFWITTTPSGERCCTRIDGTKIKAKRALISMASDPATNQCMQTREDHVVTVTHPDGTNVVEHADGTRITTFWREVQIQINTESSEETGETPDVEVRQVKVVVVECPGFATIKFDTNSLLQCSTEFGSGTVVHVSVDGSYDIYHSDGGYLQVDAEGAASYFPRPNNELEVHNPNHQLQYNMRHFADVVFDTIDNAGNRFRVTNTGETTVELANEDEGEDEVVLPASRGDSMSPEKAAQGGKVEGENVEATAPKRQLTQYKQHAPRLFICHADGSGTELLRYQDVAEYMSTAEDDPSTAILMDSLPDYPGVMGITVLRPYTQTISQKWLKPYIQETIIPAGLVSRDLTTLPAREEKKAGPKFGTNVGTGLAVGTAVRPLPPPPILKCPSKLEIRQILQYKPISEELRTGLWQGLKNYGEFIRTKLENSEILQLQDPRTPEEQEAASRLAHHAGKDASVPKKGENIKQVYERTTAWPVPSPPPTPQPKRTRADWERDERELAEEVENRQKLRAHAVPPYFSSELGQAFLLTQAPDMEAMRRMLKEDPRSDNSKAIRSNASSAASRHSSSAPPAVTTGTTPSAVRPGNPTPGHATGQGSPAAVRPHNPTPAHANKTVPERPGAPTPKQGKESESPNTHPSIQERIVEKPTPASRSMMRPSGNQASEIHDSNVQRNVVGAPRLQPVRVPAYLRTGRPLAAPNFRHGMIEDPVRRKINNSSVAGATPMGAEILARMRGIELLPTHVQFGVLREGTTYSFCVQLKNTGVETCRFKVRQPPPSTGIRVNYKPGPIAAGMKMELEVMIYAIANGVEGGRGVGQIRHQLDIITETDHLFMPITATVLTAYDYDTRAKEDPEAVGPAAGVRHVSNKAPGTTNLVRFRKSQEVAA